MRRSSRTPGDMDRRLDEIEEFLTGARSAFEADRVFATILFTDIVRSTERAAELGDCRWRALLDDHNASVRRELERHRGRLVNSTGDGVLATFDGPARAIRCGSAIARSIHELGIEVRSGLHAGEIEQRGDNIGGMRCISRRASWRPLMRERSSSRRPSRISSPVPG